MKSNITPSLETLTLFQYLNDLYLQDRKAFVELITTHFKRSDDVEMREISLTFLLECITDVKLWRHFFFDVEIFTNVSVKLKKKLGDDSHVLCSFFQKRLLLELIDVVSWEVVSRKVLGVG